MDILKNDKIIEELNTKLKNGAVIAFVTDTVWGVGCLPTSKAGVDKIYSLKNRDTSKPLILMSNDIENLKPYVNQIPPKAKSLIAEYFPGALTLIFEKSDLTPLTITSGKNTVGIRVPDNTFFKRLCEVIDGHVLATTSANLSDLPSAKNNEEAKEFIGEYVDYTFEDYGYKAKGLESTVALALTDEIKVLRQGAVHLDV